MGEYCASPRERLAEAECLDVRTFVYRKSAGEWMVLHYLKDCAASRAGVLADEIISLAEKDLREAECFHSASSVWTSDSWSPVAYDRELLYLLAMIYLSRLLLDDEQQFESCVSSLALDGLVTRDELRQLLLFARGLVSDVQLEDLALVSDQEPDATRSSVTEPDVEDLAWRLATRSSITESNRDNHLATEFLERMWKKEHVGDLFFLIENVLHSSYFLTLPRRDEGPACACSLAFIRGHIHHLEEQADAEALELLKQLKELEREIALFYAKEAVVLQKEDWDLYFSLSMEHNCDPAWGKLTAVQAKELLDKCKLPGLASSLFTMKPPNSVFSSHLLAVYDCVTHARLWLLKYLPFQICDLLGDHVDEEAEVLESPVGFGERIPSYVERLLRHQAILENDQCCGEKLVWNVRTVICSRLKVPCYLREVKDVFGFEACQHPLSLGLPATLWYETKLGFWLGVDTVRGERCPPRPNVPALEKYQDTAKFLEFVAQCIKPCKLWPPEPVQVLA